MPHMTEAKVTAVIVSYNSRATLPTALKSARDAHEKLVAGGVDSVFEIVPNGKHVMTNLIGAPFIQKLEKLR